MEYSYLLDQADESEDPYMRLVYASELFSFFNLFFPNLTENSPRDIVLRRNECQTRIILTSFDQGFVLLASNIFM